MKKKEVYPRPWICGFYSKGLDQQVWSALQNNFLGWVFPPVVNLVVVGLIFSRNN